MPMSPKIQIPVPCQWGSRRGPIDPTCCSQDLFTWAGNMDTNMHRKEPKQYKAICVCLKRYMSTHFISLFHFLRGTRAVMKKQEIASKMPINNAVYRNAPLKPTMPIILLKNIGKMTPPTTNSLVFLAAQGEEISYLDHSRCWLLQCQAHVFWQTIARNKPHQLWNSRLHLIQKQYPALRKSGNTYCSSSSCIMRTHIRNCKDIK